MDDCCDFLQKKNVYFVQVDVSSGKNAKVVYLPYTAGVIIANAFKNENVINSYEFKDFIFIRKDIETVVDEMQEPAVIGFSNYCWNTEYNLALAKAVKEKYPECITVFGGHNVPPDNSFLEKYPFIDFLVHAEGEEAFRSLLLELLKETPDFSAINNVFIVGNDGKAEQARLEKEIHKK